MTEPFSQVFLFGSFTEDEATSFQSSTSDLSFGKESEPSATAVRQNGVHAGKPASPAVRQNGHLAPSRGVNNSKSLVFSQGKATEKAVDTLGKSLGQNLKKQPARPGIAVSAREVRDAVKPSEAGSQPIKAIVSPTPKTIGQLCNGDVQHTVDHTAILTPKASFSAETGRVRNSVKSCGESIFSKDTVGGPTKVEVSTVNGSQVDWLVINSDDVLVSTDVHYNREASSDRGNGNAVKDCLVEPATPIVGIIDSSGISEASVSEAPVFDDPDARPSRLIPKSWAALVGVPGESQATSKQSTGVKGKVRGSAGQVESSRSQAAEVIPVPVTDLSGETWLKSLREAEVSGRRLQARGLINTGNSCFLNSTVQAMLSCSAFTHLLQVLNARNIPQVGYPTLRAFLEFSGALESSPVRNLMKTRRDGDLKAPPSVTDVGKPFAPAMFDPVLHSFTPDQAPRGTGRNRQEDAQEFLSFVIDRMHEEILRLQGKDSPRAQSVSSITSSEDDDWEMVGPKNRSAVTRTHTFSESAITDIFGGQLRSVVKTKGNKASATVQPFLVLHLDIVPEVVHSVEDALRFFAAPESLEGYKPSTSKVGEVVTASKSVKIQTLPRVLILHLMRFSYGSGGSSKLHKPVQFPLELSLGRELLASTAITGNEIRKYELIATLSHHGKDPSVGHYTADSKQASGQWLRFDDGVVIAVGVTRVLQEQAYVLFYKRASP